MQLLFKDLQQRGNTKMPEVSLPVIHLTVYAEETTFQREKLTKPFEEPDLPTTIMMALDKLKMERRLLLEC